jgi:hypothetical protein
MAILGGLTLLDDPLFRPGGVDPKQDQMAAQIIDSLDGPSALIGAVPNCVGPGWKVVSNALPLKAVTSLANRSGTRKLWRPDIAENLTLTSLWTSVGSGPFHPHQTDMCASDPDCDWSSDHGNEPGSETRLPSLGGAAG